MDSKLIYIILRNTVTVTGLLESRVGNDLILSSVDRTAEPLRRKRSEPRLYIRHKQQRSLLYACLFSR